MATEQELLDARARVWDQMQAILDTAAARAEGARDLTADEVETYGRLEADLDGKSKEIELVKANGSIRSRHEGRARDFAAPANPGALVPSRDSDEQEDRYHQAFRSFLKRGNVGLDVEERKVLATGLTNDPEVRAQAVGTGSAGGYLVPAAFRQEFIVRMKDFGSVQAVAQVIETETGASLPWATMDDTSNVGALLAENTQMAEQDVAVGTASLDAYMYTSKLTRASYQVVNDAAFDVETIVRNAHAERIGRITNQHFTTGTGTAQPDGIVTSAVNGKTAAGVAAITGDELIDLVHSVDPAYRNSPRAQFMLSDTALALIRKLKDSNGMYLWQPSVQAGVASSLFGYPYVINQDMAVPATGVKSVLFGDFFAGYVIRIVQGIQTITFAERFADYLQVAWA
jgi:HK97 family phage major capsid protein